jgi:hypothetical protein
MSYLLRLLLIAALVWALLRFLRALLFGPPSPRRSASGQQRQGSGRGGSQASGGTSESLVSCEACGLRVPESEAMRVRMPDGEHRVCSPECRKRL